MVSRYLLVLALLCGCADLRSFPPETRAEELTWQTLHAIDISQTHGIAHDPDCYYEMVSDPLIGRHPSQGAVALWGITWATLHFVITDLMVDHDAPPWLVRGWMFVTIGSTAYWVHHNNQIGIRPFGHNEGTCEP